VASYKRRQSSDYNQSVPETQNVPEQHAYQEKHFQPVLNQPVPETRTETEYGSTVTPDTIETRAEKTPHSTYTEQSDQPGEDDLANMQIRQNLQNNTDSGTQYSTPDVSSGVSSGPGGFTGIETTATTAAATTTAATTTVVASTAATTITTVATATVGATIIAVAFILPLVVGVPSAIIFDDISVTDTTIYYSIYFEDYEEGMDLTVSLHNNFTDRSHKVESESISILEENLKPGMTYRLTVYGSMGAILDERTVKTDKSPSGPSLDMKNFDYSPQEGRILIDSELTGDTTGLSAFKAVIYADVNDTRTVIFAKELETVDGEQTIPLSIDKDMKYSATFTIQGKNQEGETVELYTNDLTVYGTPYYSAPSFSFSNNTLTVVCGYYDPYSLRSDYKLMVKVLNSQSQEPIIREVPLNSGVTTVEDIAVGFSVFEMMAYTQYTENGDIVYPPDSSYEYNSLNDLVTTGIGRATVNSTGSPEGSLSITVGDCLEELVAVIKVTDPASGDVYQNATLVSNVTDNYTFDLLSLDNVNKELEFHVEVFNAITPISGANGTVVFAYASYVDNSLTTAVLNPSANGPGLEVNFDVVDPYGIWSDYRATVTSVGVQPVVELCRNVPIVDNKVYFTVTDFDFDKANVTITCTQDGNTVQVAQIRTIDVYSGPSLIVNDYLYPVSSNQYDQTIYLDSKFDEFGTTQNPKTMYVYLLQGDYSVSSGAFTTEDIGEDQDYGKFISVVFEVDCPPFLEGELMNLEIRDSDNNLIARLEDATMIQV
jgi:hypothetical protein